MIVEFITDPAGTVLTYNAFSFEACLKSAKAKETIKFSPQLANCY